MLGLAEVSAGYRGVPVLHDVSLNVATGESIAVLGPNNAGKSTLLKCICGLCKPITGKIIYNGDNLLALPPHEIANRGLAMVPEGRGIFAEMTVEENLLLGSCISRAKPARQESFERVFHLFPVLKQRSRQRAGTLSGGEQQMLALGRALMAKPDVLLLDEPSLGLSPIIIKNIYAVLKVLNSQGLAILMVEQNMNLALSLCSRGYILSNGRIVLSGGNRELKDNEAARKAYLGLITEEATREGQ